MALPAGKVTANRLFNLTARFLNLNLVNSAVFFGAHPAEAIEKPADPSLKFPLAEEIPLQYNVIITITTKIFVSPPEKVVYFSVGDEAVIFDIDTPKEYEDLIAKLN